MLRHLWGLCRLQQKSTQTKMNTFLSLLLIASLVYLRNVVVTSVAAYQQGIASPSYRRRLSTRTGEECKIQCFLQHQRVNNDDDGRWWITKTSKTRRVGSASFAKLSNHDDNDDIENVDDRRQEIPTQSTTTESSHPPSNNNNSNSDFDSLDVMLNRARKRPTNKIYQVQVFLDTAVIQFPSPWGRIVFTMSDLLLLGVSSIILDAYGFAIGLLIGKVTIRPFLKIVQPSPAVSILLVPSWPVIWAIVLDQIL